MIQTTSRQAAARDRSHDGHHASAHLRRGEAAAPPAVRRPAAPGGTQAQHDILARLRDDDGTTLAGLFRDHNDSMVALARTFVRDADVAEEVVQETWMAVLNGIDRFEGRASLRTWVLSILANKARRRARQEGRSVPLSSVAGEDGDEGASFDRFEAAASWMEPLHATGVNDPERIVGGRELVVRLAAAMDDLPQSQRAVVLMRDIEGRSAEETSAALGISAANQRVLLHRGHASLRETLGEAAGPGQA